MSFNQQQKKIQKIRPTNIFIALKFKILWHFEYILGKMFTRDEKKNPNFQSLLPLTSLKVKENSD
jgi:hypothetical protein